MRRLLPLAVLLPSWLAAQAPAERRFLDSVLVAMAVPGGEAAAAARCAGREASVRRVCEGMATIRSAERSLDKGESGKARDQFERLVTERPDWPVAWYGLGVARLQAARSDLVARQGPLHPLGSSNEVGAANALIRALELDTAYHDAARALALASLPREGPSSLGNRLAALKRHRALLDAPGLYGAGVIAVETGEDTTAIGLLNLALHAPGTRPGLVSLALARAYYRNGEPEAGRRAYFEGGADSARVSVAAYRTELAWVAEPAELAAWDSLAPAKRPGWLEEFWARRDVRDARPAGSRLKEHYVRIEFALKEFRKIIPAAGAGAAKFGGVAMTTDYMADEIMLRFADEYLVGLDEEMKFQIQRGKATHETIGAGSPFRAFNSTRALLDDRGAIWIRHGKPDRTAKTADGIALEVWRYERPDGPLVVQFKEVNFDGQAGASVLVPTLITENPLQRDQVCGLEPSLCSSNADPRSGAITVGAGGRQTMQANPSIKRMTDDARMNSPSRVAEVKERGMEALTEATTTDDHRRRFAKAFAPAVQIYGLDRAEGGAPRLVVAFAVPGAELEYSAPPEAGGRAIYPVRLELMVARRGDGRRFDLDTLRRFATTTPLGEGQYLTGMVEFPLPAGTYAATVVLSQGERGSTARVPAVVVPDGRGTLQLSDLVLGREGAGVRWQSGTTPVALNPLNTYPKGGTAEVYYQLAGTTAGTAYQHRIELFGADDAPGKAPQLSLSFEQRATGPRAEVTRSFGLGKVNPGRYRVRLTVTGAGGETSSTAWLTILK